MSRTTLRGLAFWTAVVTGLILLMISAMYVLLQFSSEALALSLGNFDLQTIYQAMSVFRIFFEGLNTVSLLLFFGLLHYDLMTTQRLSEHARDYMIRDLTQSAQPENSRQSRPYTSRGAD
ncbi:MAG TPA: hypothetical protein PLY87_26175 [Planctomycetaceae bacterium]|nr:hypothetical protein [Planctomycetaceae bacterium]HQZ68612.1 hypothetical protein [Planctomycetaceae bacterium]